MFSTTPCFRKQRKKEKEKRRRERATDRARNIPQLHVVSAVTAKTTEKYR